MSKQPRQFTSIPIEEITFDDVRSFCALQVKENLHLEYKREFSSNDRGKQIAREVVAFANTQGGVIVLGVGETEDRTPEREPDGTKLGSDPRNAVLQACIERVSPTLNVAVSDYLPNPDNPERGFVVVRVAPSADIHALEDGTKIYIRHADHSSPMLASLDRIDHLLGKRKALVDQQAQRRTNALQRLSWAKGGDYQRGCVCVTLGPDLDIRPFFSRGELRDKARSFIAESHYFNASPSPIGPTDPSGFIDGVYSIDRYEDFGGMIDIYGNVSLFANTSRAEKVESIYAHLSGDELAAVTDEDGCVFSIEARLVIERLLTACRSAILVSLEAGFGGTLLGSLIVHCVSGSMLTFWRDSPSMLAPLGICHTEEHIDIPLSLVVSDVSDDTSLADALRPTVDRLLWAWSNTDDEARSAILDRAERAHFGETKCPKHERHMRPRDRASCLECRKEATL